MFVSRALRLEQLVCSPACGAAVTHYKAWLSGERWQSSDAPQTSTAAPTDPVASQLRQHQEQEVLQLLSQRQGKEQYKEDVHNVRLVPLWLPASPRACKNNRP